MRRTQIEERELFGKDTRLKLLEKSEGKCCKCGKGLSLRTMTVDHFIPISRGGTNNINNLIPLCVDCNKVKTNNIYSPYDFIKYIREEDLKDLASLYKYYCEDIKWYNINNLTKEDKVTLTYPLVAPSVKGRLRTDKMGAYTTVGATAVLEKVRDDSLAEVYDYVKKYMEKFNLDTYWLISRKYSLNIPVSNRREAILNTSHFNFSGTSIISPLTILSGTIRVPRYSCFSDLGNSDLSSISLACIAGE